MSDEFKCEQCGATFRLAASVAAKYPGWRPRRCPACYRNADGPASGEAARPGRRRPAGRTSLRVADVLDRHRDGPDSGVFTDGSATPNPGPGGWGAVYVVDGEIVAQEHGQEPDTTNNRMELLALIRGAGLVPQGEPATLYTDSRLCHDTITQWAAGWEKRGWRRKSGEIANLDLVRELYDTLGKRPELRLAWVPAHSGYRWNEYADALATAYLRDEI